MDANQQINCEKSIQMLLKDKKSERMQRTDRIHNKRLQYAKKWIGWGASIDQTTNWVQISLETPKRGSKCRCCNNPRKNEKGKAKLTLQERRQQDHETSLAD